MSENNLPVPNVPENDATFLPAAWIESLASVLASFLADPRLRYSQGVQPNIVEGELCLVVATWLETTDRATYRYIMDFAKAHQLETRLDRRTGERAIQQPA